MDELNVFVERMGNNIDAHDVTVIPVAEAGLLIKRITALQKMEDDFKKAVSDAFVDLMSATKKEIIK